MNKISTLKYLLLRDKNKVNFSKISKKEVDRLSSILNYSINKFYDQNLSKKQFKIIYDSSIAIISEHYLASEKIYITGIEPKDDYFQVPINVFNLKLLQESKDFSLIKSIINIKKYFDKTSKINFQQIRIKKEKKNKKIKDVFKEYLFKLTNILFSFYKNKIFLDIFNLNFYIRFIAKGYSPQFFSISKKYFFKKDYNIEIRYKLYELGNKLNKTEEEKKSWFVLIFQLPLSLIEEFITLNNVHINYDNKIKKFILSNIRKNEIETLFIAKNLQKSDTQVELYQYGCGLFFQKQENFTTQLEYEIADKVYSWSKSDDLKNAKIPLFKAYSKKKQDLYNLDNILLVNTSSAFFLKFGNGPMFEGIFKNFLNQIKFLNHLKTSSKNINIKDQIYENENFNKFKIYKKNKLDKFLTNQKLEVLIKKNFPICSYLGTFFLEMMANDIPHILFYRPREFNPTSKVEKYLKKMKKYGFIYYNPINAANFILKNENKIQELWEEKEFTKLRNDFREEFCNNPYNWQKKFFDQINL